MSHSTSNPPSRTSTPAKFTQPSETLEDALKTQTVGLVNLRDFQKRRVELAEQRDREAAESKLPSAAGSAGSRSGQASREASAGPSGGEGKQGNKKKKRKLAVAKGKLSFGGEDEEDGNADGDGESSSGEMKRKSRSVTAERKGPATDDQQEDISTAAAADTGTGNNNTERKRKFNPKLKAPPPKALTKSTLLREAQEREMLRREFLQLQEKIKNEDITIPFVFYDGTNVPPPNNEPVTVKKGEAVWLFLERARRVSGRREWLRVSVDDLLLVRGDLIIPHHYEFYYFIANRTVGPNGILFDYPSPLDPNNNNNDQNNDNNSNGGEGSGGEGGGGGGGGIHGGKEDPTLTKVVDRRWYERNKHIFPASIWTEFDPNADYTGMVRRDLGGNAFFFG